MHWRRFIAGWISMRRGSYPGFSRGKTIRVMMILRRTIPHKEQLYDTVGDWWCSKPDILHITVSRMSNTDYEWLVGIHEQIEAELCIKAGVEGEDVTAFD